MHWIDETIAQTVIECSEKLTQRVHVDRHDMYNVENCLMTSSSPDILLIVHISVKDETGTNDNSTWCV